MPAIPHTCREAGHLPASSGSLGQPSERTPDMLGIIAAILFVIAFLLNLAGTSTPAVFTPTSLMLAGLACLALHLSGVGTGWNWRRR
jgi:hypothetical protein